MSFRTAGIHHVTGIASDPQRNLDFYAGILGLRLVKRTVNFDDPTTYHFYFGDESGNPGSILTFFPWPEARRGRQGGGQVAVTSFSILPSSVGFWIERLIKKRVEFEQPVARYEDERVIAFKDHEGFMGELVAHPAAAAFTGWSGAGVPAEHAIRSIYSVTLWLDANERTGNVIRQCRDTSPACHETENRGPFARACTSPTPPSTLPANEPSARPQDQRSCANGRK